MPFALTEPQTIYYDYTENKSERSDLDLTFRWLEPLIPMESLFTGVYSGENFEGALTYTTGGTGDARAFAISSEGTVVPCGPYSGETWYSLSGTSYCLWPGTGEAYIESPELGYDSARKGFSALLKAKGEASGVVYIKTTGEDRWWDLDQSKWTDVHTENIIDFVYNDSRALNVNYKGITNQDTGDADFTIAGLKVSTLSGYSTTGTYLIVDDLRHGDVSGESLVKYTVADTYKLQITRDQGWNDIELAFNDRRSDDNRYLYEKTLSGSALTPLDDGSIYTTLTNSEFKEACPSPGDYVWRVLPINSFNNTVDGGSYSRFKYDVNPLNTGFTVEPFEYEADKAIQKIKGGRPEGATITATGLGDLTVSYPTVNTYLLEFSLSSIKTTATITCTNESGASVSKTLILKIPERLTLAIIEKQDLDHLGDLFSCERLPKEDNPSYLERIKNSARYRTDVTRVGVKYGIANNLGLPPVLEGIHIPASQGKSVAVTNISVEIHSDSFVGDEVLYPNRYLKRATLSYCPANIGRVYNKNGDDIDYEVDGQDLLVDEDKITVEYTYKEVYYFWEYSTLESLAAAIGGYLGDDVAGDELTAGLFIQPKRLMSETTILRWSPVIVIDTASEDLRDHYGKTQTSKYTSWIKQAIIHAYPHWGNIFFDRSYWDTGVRNADFEPIPTLTDPDLAKYSDSTYTYDEFEYEFFDVGYNNTAIIARGLKPGDINSGVAGKRDLKPGLTTDQVTATVKFSRRLSHTHGPGTVK